MTVFVNGSPAANLTQSNTFLEWVSLTNQMLTDGQDTANVMPDSTVSEDAVVQHLTREQYNMGANDSPNFGGVIIDWNKIKDLGQDLSSNATFEANVAIFHGNVFVNSPDFIPSVSRQFNVKADSNGYYISVGNNNVTLREGDGIRLVGIDGKERVFLSTDNGNSYYLGKLGIGTQTPNNELEVVGSINAPEIRDDGFEVYSGNNVPNSQSIVGLENVNNETQVPKSGGTFTGNVFFNDTANILGQWFFDGNEIKLSSIPSITELELTGKSFDVFFQNGQHQGLRFNNDGSKFYTATFSNAMYQYDLSTNFDITTATHNGNTFEYSTETDETRDFSFNNDGSRMYIPGDTNLNVFQYDLSTNFDITTASYNGNTFDLSIPSIPFNTIAGLTFNDTGSKMYITENNTDNVYQYSLSTEFDITTASYTSGDTIDISAQDSGQGSIRFNENGSIMYLLGTFNEEIYEYDLSTPFDITTASYNGNKFSIDAASEGQARGMTINKENSAIYFLNASGTIYEYKRFRKLIL